MEALASGNAAAIQMIDTSVVRVHQHGACIVDNNQSWQKGILSNSWKSLKNQGACGSSRTTNCTGSPPRMIACALPYRALSMRVPRFEVNTAHAAASSGNSTIASPVATFSPVWLRTITSIRTQRDL
jgi:hypothetical protein